MSFVHFGRGLSAAALAVGMSAVGISAQDQPAASSTPAQKVTITGCVQRESDFRKMQDAGRGGVAGTGVGVGNEFVLTNATIGPAASSAPPSSAAPSAGQPSPAPSASGPGSAYELTGSAEGQAAQHVGKRVEITGVLKAAATTAAGAPTGGPTAGRPPSGVDVASKDLKLREIEVTTIREVGSTCPA